MCLNALKLLSTAIIVTPTSPNIGLSSVTVNAVQLQSKSVTPTASSQTVSPGTGYLGLSSVTVNATPLESKSVTPTTSSQTISPTSPNIGLSSVTVNAIPSEYIVPTGSVSITENGTVNVSSYASAEVNVPGLDTSDATATADEICLSKTAYIATGKVTGTGDMVHTVETVPSSMDTSIIKVNSTSDYYAWRPNGTAPTGQTATAADILATKTAMVNGGVITGSMVNNGAVTETIAGGETYTITGKARLHRLVEAHPLLLHRPVAVVQSSTTTMERYSIPILALKLPASLRSHLIQPIPD